MYTNTNARVPRLARPGEFRKPGFRHCRQQSYIIIVIVTVIILNLIFVFIGIATVNVITIIIIMTIICFAIVGPWPGWPREFLEPGSV